MPDIRGLALGFAGLCLAARTTELGEPPTPVHVAPPEGWVAPPSIAQVQAAYPDRAKSAHVVGTAEVTCVVTAAGALGNCAVTQEEPSGWGFGEAALSLAPAFKVAAGPDGRSDQFSATIRFAPSYDRAHETDRDQPGWAVKTWPSWFVYPSRDEFAWVYPDRANRMGVSGHARLACTVLPTGEAVACSVISEDPADQNFGAAAIKLAPHFLLRPTTYDGEPVAAPAIVPVKFALPPY